MTEANHLIAIVGVESTGKTTLAQQLAAELKGAWLPEYAREYLQDSNYNEADLMRITQEQLAREINFVRSKPKFGVLDTDGIVLYVWWQERFGYVPNELQQHLFTQATRRYLLTSADLTWEFDSLRESRDDLNRLSGVYVETLRAFGFDYDIVQGSGSRRLECALECLNIG